MTEIARVDILDIWSWTRSKAAAISVSLIESDITNMALISIFTSQPKHFAFRFAVLFLMNFQIDFIWESSGTFIALVSHQSIELYLFWFWWRSRISRLLTISTLSFWFKVDTNFVCFSNFFQLIHFLQGWFLLELK